MRDEFVNRMGMFKTVSLTLMTTLNKALWFNLPPLIFTTRVADAQTAVGELETFCAAQEEDITGAADQKTREAVEAEEVGFQIARALVEWFRDHNDEINAAKVDVSRSKWHKMRGQTFKDQLTTTLGLAQTVVAGPNAAAAVGYGITPANVTILTKEIQDYADVMSAPQSSIAERKGLTGLMRTRFNAVESKFVTLDNLILQFHGTSDGRLLIAAYQASRVVRDLGHSGLPQPPSNIVATPGAPGSASVSVTWQGTAVNYRVRLNAGPTVVAEQLVSAHQAMFNGLTAGATLTVNVTAINGTGESKTPAGIPVVVP